MPVGLTGSRISPRSAASAMSVRICEPSSRMQSGRLVRACAGLSDIATGADDRQQPPTGAKNGRPRHDGCRHAERRRRISPRPRRCRRERRRCEAIRGSPAAATTTATLASARQRSGGSDSSVPTAAAYRTALSGVCSRASTACVWERPNRALNSTTRAPQGCQRECRRTAHPRRVCTAAQLVDSRLQDQPG